MKRGTYHLTSQKPGVLTLTTVDSLMVTGYLDHFQWVLKKKKRTNYSILTQADSNLAFYVRKD